MKIADAKKELCYLVERIPEEQIPAARKMLESLILYSEKQYDDYEDEELSEHELKALESADDDIENGRVKMWEQIRAEREVLLLSRAERVMAALDDEMYHCLKPVIDNMAVNLQSLSKKKIQGFNDRWRIRVGEWRIICKEDKAADTIYMLSIVMRKAA